MGGVRGVRGNLIIASSINGVGGGIGGGRGDEGSAAGG